MKPNLYTLTILHPRCGPCFEDREREEKVDVMAYSAADALLQTKLKHGAHYVLYPSSDHGETPGVYVTAIEPAKEE